MARKAGSDGGSDSGEGAIPNTLTREQYLQAVQEQTAFNAERKQLNERINARRKVFASWGVKLQIMDAKIKIASWERDEIREHYERDREYALWLNLPVGTQADMFEAGTADDDVSRNEWYHAGITARLLGKPRVAPDDCPEQYLLAWDAGYDDKPITSAGAGTRAGSGKKQKAKRAKGEPKPGRKVKGAIAKPPVTKGDGLKLVGGKDTAAETDGIGGPGTPGHSEDPVVH